jgi:hypothetical protein
VPIARPLTVQEAKRWLRVGSVVVVKIKRDKEWLVLYPHNKNNFIPIIYCIEHDDCVVLLER